MFILLAGDSDDTPLVGRLREDGTPIIGVGTQANASPPLIQVCSEYKYWGTILAMVQPAARAVVAATFDITGAERLLIRAFQALGADTATAGGLKNRMLAVDPSFEEANYGCSAFRAFLARVRNIGKSGEDLRIHLIEPSEEGTDGI